jgi:peptidoglycan hydrolase-like protein with peptidoglycan-binding domain
MPLALTRLTPSTTRKTATTSSPTLARGAKGSQVTELQKLLEAAGVSPGRIDGDFGPMTQAAVRRFQQAKGLVVDGVVGPKTWAALRSSGSAPTTSTTPTLRQGDFGAAVETLQRQLDRHGFSPGGIDGQFGAKTRRALVDFQRAHGLNADGVAGPATWQALNGPVTPKPVPPVTNGEVRSRMLDIARGEIGTLETGGNNKGAVLKYPNAFGRGSEAYCADFASWVSKQAGLTMNNPYCPSVVNELKRRGDWKGTSNPQPGDLVLFDWDGDKVADHVGIVEKVNANGSITTIEGNTENPQTGKQGVWRRERSMSTVLGFGNPY